jgi:hypothetical protein
MKYWLRFIFLICISSEAWAAGLVELDTSVRALGMGNAYTGVVKNADSLFYNPAGIGKITGFHWTIMDPYGGYDNINAMTDIKDIQGEATFADTVGGLYGEHIWVGAGGKSAFSMPYFAFAVYDHLDSSLDFLNPVYPSLDISVINDYGYAAGTAFPVVPGFVHFGMALKYVTRTGSAVPFGPSYFASLDPQAIVDAIENKGTGYSLNAGLNVMVPGPVSPTFSLVWKDIGVTKYKTELLTDTPPPQQLDEMIFGAAINIDLPFVSISPAIDFKHLNRTDVQLGNKIHFGVEVGLPIIDIRAGFNQGYYTWGLGADLGLLKIDMASYGVELGAYPGQREDRRFIAQLTLELGFDFGGVFGDSASGGKKKKGDSSNSSWFGGPKKLKQRR